MKKYFIGMLTVLLTVSCNSQEKKKKDSAENLDKSGVVEAPKGSWKVNKEFDEAGNLIRYDSIYSWSSETDLGQLADMDRDSILNAMRSRFYSSFSGFGHKGFPNLFAEDSLFTKQFFNDDFFDSDFGHDFMDIDQVRKRMEHMQRKFLERYGAEFEKRERKEQ